ncbi:substrate-binding domain-containing protein [Actinoplanes sp. NEAU-A12]|uniref:Substrate-binding domain-containing protein n=1 Tax=Actinoplanes sandaracinus TaxID=3045177 RepID=A0ABT6WIC9_9ACTN|nr:substrate-binding domain-containing protein [Actinoplanes sandaracinus]MDI6099491.1 substrate-binding domain-containing protein [Actinoplanes sandaracinus]
MTQAPRRVGLVLERASQVLGEEPYYHEFLEGLERVLTPAGVSVLVQVVTDREAESATYARWAGQRRVDGVILVDLGPDDERVGLVTSLELPAVVIGDPSTSQGLPTVWTDDAGFAEEVVGFLYGLGHRMIGHVTGPPRFAHTQMRQSGLAAEAAERAMTLLVAEGDYSFDGGRAATRELLRGRPSALVFDNDVMALGGLAAAADRGLRVPADLSVVAWDDSAQCQLAVPALSAMSHDVERIGELAAEAVLAAMAGAPAAVYQAPSAHIVVRDSTHPL